MKSNLNIGCHFPACTNRAWRIFTDDNGQDIPACADHASTTEAVLGARVLKRVDLYDIRQGGSK